MSEFLSDPRVLQGCLLGLLLFVAVWFIAGRITAAALHSEKAKAGYRDSLLSKLNEAGYTVYSPLILSSQMNLKDSLTHEEEMVLSLDAMMVFDAQGNSLTALVPLTSRSEQLAQERRASFRVIPGAKN